MIVEVEVVCILVYFVYILLVIWKNGNINRYVKVKVEILWGVIFIWVKSVEKGSISLFGGYFLIGYLL